jgi:hypothetical protein
VKLVSFGEQALHRVGNSRRTSPREFIPAYLGIGFQSRVVAFLIRSQLFFDLINISKKQCPK